MLPHVVLLSLLLSSAVPFWFDAGEIKKDSNNTLIYVGDNITLHCHKKSPFAENVQFKIIDNVVPSEYVKVINTTYARMDRPATSADNLELSFICRDAAAPLVGSQTMYTEFRPQKVSNLQTVYYDKTTAFFSWDLGLVAYKYQPWMNPNRLVTVVTANYSTDNATWYPCPPANATSGEAHTSCQIVTDLAGGLWLLVSVKNLFRGDAAEKVFYIDDLNNYVKPKPVEKLEAKSISSTAVTLNWYNDRSGLAATVTYRNDRQAKPQVVEVPTDVSTITINHLHPFSNYTFEVQAKPSRGYLSNAVSVTILMPEDGME